MNRQVFLSGIGIVLVASAFVLTDHLLYAPGVTLQAARRVRLGMTLEEAELVFGTPVDTDPQQAFGNVQWWSGTQGVAIVLFDDEMRVCSMRFLAPDRQRCLLRLSSPGELQPAFLDLFYPFTRPEAAQLPLLDRLRSWLSR